MIHSSSPSIIIDNGTENDDNENENDDKSIGSSTRSSSSNTTTSQDAHVPVPVMRGTTTKSISTQFFPLSYAYTYCDGESGVQMGGLMRIMFGVLFLYDRLLLILEYQFWFGGDQSATTNSPIGVLPSWQQQQQQMQQTQHPEKQLTPFLNLFRYTTNDVDEDVDDTVLVQFLLGIGVFHGICVVLGIWKPKLQVFCIYLQIVSFQHRGVNMIYDQQDALLVLVSFYLLFLPLDSKYTLYDYCQLVSWWKKKYQKKKYQTDDEKDNDNDNDNNNDHKTLFWPFRLLQIQTCCIYAGAGLHKLCSEKGQWTSLPNTDGTMSAMYIMVHQQDFFQNGLFVPPALLFNSQGILQLLTYLSVLLECSCGIVVWVGTPTVRYGMTWCMILFHVSIELAMNLHLFQWLSILCWCSFFVQPATAESEELHVDKVESASELELELELELAATPTPTPTTTTTTPTPTTTTTTTTTTTKQISGLSSNNEEVKADESDEKEVTTTTSPSTATSPSTPTPTLTKRKKKKKEKKNASTSSWSWCWKFICHTFFPCLFASCVMITTVPYFDMVYYSGLCLQLYTDTAVADASYDYYALHYRRPLVHFIHQSLGMQSIFGLEQNIWSMYATVPQRNIRIIGEVVWKPKQTTTENATTTTTPTPTPIVSHFTSPEWSAATSSTTGRTSVASLFSKKRKYRQVLFWKAVHWEQLIQYTLCRRWAQQATERVLANNNNNNSTTMWVYEIDYVALKQRTIMLSNPATTSTVTNNTNDDYDYDYDDDDDDGVDDTVKEHQQQQSLSSSLSWWSSLSLSFHGMTEWLFEPVDSENKFQVFFEDLLYVYRPNHHTRIEEGDGTYEVNQQLVYADADTELTVNVTLNVNLTNGKNGKIRPRRGWDSTNEGVWWDQRYYHFNSERGEFLLDRSKTTTTTTTIRHVVVGDTVNADGGNDVPRNVNDNDNHHERNKIEDPNNRYQQEKEEEEEEEEEQDMKDDDPQQYEEL